MSRFRPDVDAPEYKGSYSPYDIIKEGTIAIAVILVLTLVLSVLFGSPDEKAVTIKTWSNASPIDFATTALGELNGTAGTAAYGPPYNTAADGQQLGPLKLAKLVGVRIPINAAKDFVVSPLESQPFSTDLRSALTTWKSASTGQQTTWVNAYTKVAAKMSFTGGHVTVPSAADGPVPVMIDTLTTMARSGALDQALVTGHGFYTTDYTKALLFLADGSYLADKAAAQHLAGSQWGMMNETGSYPGQAWLWLASMWYQIPPFNTSWGANADVLVLTLVSLLSLVMLFMPFIPGLRSIPRRVKVYRLIWREHYRDQ